MQMFDWHDSFLFSRTLLCIYYYKYISKEYVQTLRLINISQSIMDTTQFNFHKKKKPELQRIVRLVW